MRATHTYAVLHLSEAAYLEIREKLERAGYQDQFHHNEDAPASPVIDMHGIAVAPEVEMIGNDREQLR